jgi:hypothetical protein
VTLVWVTGISGAGKSTVCDMLKSRGCVAVDADWEGYNRWVDRRTGAVAVDAPSPVPPEWTDDHAWEIDVDRVRALARRVEPGVAFLFGSVENERDAWDLFDAVVCIVVDDETVRHRLATRSTNDFGKHPDELAKILGWNQTVEETYRHFGATIVDGTQPPTVVADKVEAVATSFVRP